MYAVYIPIWDASLPFFSILSSIYARFVVPLFVFEKETKISWQDNESRNRVVELAVTFCAKEDNIIRVRLEPGKSQARKTHASDTTRTIKEEKTMYIFNILGKRLA